MPGAMFDFYSPFASATIVTEDGIRVPLWTGPQALQSDIALSTPAGQRVYSVPWLQELSVEMQMAHVPIIRATLTPPYNEAMAFLDSPLIEWARSILEVQFGYAGGAPEGPVLSPIYTGVILKPDVQIGADVTITLNAQGVGGFGMSHSTSGGDDLEGTRIKIIEDLVKGPKGNRPIEVDTTEVELAADLTRVRNSILRVQGAASSALAGLFGFQGEAPEVPETNEYQALFEETVVQAQGYVTDWFMVWRLVRECRCTMALIGNTLKIFPVNSIYAKKPSRTFALFHFPGGVVGPVNGVFPILSASSPTMAVYLPAGVKGLVLNGIDSNTRQILQGQINDETERLTRVGDGIAALPESENNPGVDETTGDGGQSMPGDPTDNAAVAQAKAEFQALANNMGVNMTWESLGDPLMVPGEVAALRGLGRRLDGNYGVLKTTHTIGASGYTMSLEGVSNIMKVAEVFSYESDLLPLGEVNTEEGAQASTSSDGSQGTSSAGSSESSVEVYPTAE